MAFYRMYGGGGYSSDIEVGVEKVVGTITINGTKYTRYVKIVDCGALPNSTTKTVNLDFDFVGILDYYGISKSNDLSNPYFIRIPWLAANSAKNVVALIDYTNKSIRLTTTSDMSSYAQTHFFLEYYR